VVENGTVAATSLFTLSNPSNDSITTYALWDDGIGNGYFILDGIIQPVGQWIYVNASNLSDIRYVGGSSPGSETLFVSVYDALTSTWIDYPSLTATTTSPDGVAPTVSSVAASGVGITNGTGHLGVGSVVTLTVNLSEAVTVAGGSPT